MSLMDKITRLVGRATEKAGPLLKQATENAGPLLKQATEKAGPLLKQATDEGGESTEQPTGAAPAQALSNAERAAAAAAESAAAYQRYVARPAAGVSGAERNPYSPGRATHLRWLTSIESGHSLSVKNPGPSPAA